MYGRYFLLLFLYGKCILQIYSQVFELTEINFDKLVRDKDIMLVEFFMPWCKHCQALQPEWETAEQVLERNREFILGKVNCWEAGKSLCDKLNVQMYPDIRLYRHGKFIESYDGDRNAAAILEYVQRAQATTGKVGTTPFWEKDNANLPAAPPVLPAPAELPVPVPVPVPAPAPAPAPMPVPAQHLQPHPAMGHPVMPPPVQPPAPPPMFPPVQPPPVAMPPLPPLPQPQPQPQPLPAPLAPQTADAFQQNSTDYMFGQPMDTSPPVPISSVGTYALQSAGAIDVEAKEACQRLKTTFQILKEQYQKVQNINITWGSFGTLYQTKRSLFKRLVTPYVRYADTKRKTALSAGEKGLHPSNTDTHNKDTLPSSVNATTEKLNTTQSVKYVDGKGLLTTTPVQEHVIQKKLTNDSNSYDNKFSRMVELLKSLSKHHSHNTTVVGQKRQGDNDDDAERDFLVKEIKATKDFLLTHRETDKDDCTAFENLMLYELQKLTRHKRNNAT